jgi:hypothetical protein
MPSGGVVLNPVTPLLLLCLIPNFKTAVTATAVPRSAPSTILCAPKECPGDRHVQSRRIRRLRN